MTICDILTQQMKLVLFLKKLDTLVYMIISEQRNFKDCTFENLEIERSLNESKNFRQY